MNNAPKKGHVSYEVIERLVKEWQTPLLRLCYIQLQDVGMAEDAVQETFIKAYNNWNGFHGNCSEKTWLTKIAINTCRDIKKGKWFHYINRKISLDMIPETMTNPTDEQVIITLAIMNLPIKIREAIVLYYYQNMDTREIGTVLGIAQPSV